MHLDGHNPNETVACLRETSTLQILEFLLGKSMGHLNFFSSLFPPPSQDIQEPETECEFSFQFTFPINMI